MTYCGNYCIPFNFHLSIYLSIYLSLSISISISKSKYLYHPSIIGWQVRINVSHSNGFVAPWPISRSPSLDHQNPPAKWMLCPSSEVHIAAECFYMLLQTSTWIHEILQSSRQSSMFLVIFVKCQEMSRIFSNDGSDSQPKLSQVVR